MFCTLIFIVNMYSISMGNGKVELYDLFDIDQKPDAGKILGRIIPPSYIFTEEVRELARGSVKGYRSDIGCFMMSCMEANVARVFMLLGEDVFYEPELFKLQVRAGYGWEYAGRESSYVPDFADSRKILYEVKGGWKRDSKGNRAMLRICNFLEQYPDRELVLIQDGDFRGVFPGLKPRFRKIVSYRDLERKYRKQIDEHPLLHGWEHGARKRGFRLYTDPDKF